MSLAIANPYIPARYALSLDVSPLKKNYSGNVVIELKSNDRFKGDTQDGLFSISLHTLQIVSMRAELVLDGTTHKLKTKMDAKSQSTRYFSDSLDVSELERAADTPVLRISFLAVVHEILTFREKTTGVFKTHYTDPVSGKATLQLLTTHTQPYFARSIFPCLDEVFCKCPVQLTLTISKEYQCVSVMPIETTVENKDSKTVTFQQTPPMSLSAFSFALGNLAYVESSTKLMDNPSFPIRVYAQVGEVQRAECALNTLVKYLPLIEHKFGVHYPLPKLDLVVVPFLSDGGVENWSMIQVCSSQMLRPLWEVPAKELAHFEANVRIILVHEMVHMYMGNYVSYDSYDYTWLNEAYATYMADCLLQENDNPDLFADLISTDLPGAQSRDRSILARQIAAANVKTGSINETFTREAYEKGIYVVKMLAAMMDTRDSFFVAVGQFVEAHKFGTFKPVDLWNFLKTCPQNKYKYDVPTVMNSWIRTAGYPLIAVGDDGTVVQKRFLEDESDRQSIEDVPYLIPLLVKTTEGKLARQLVTDRKLAIEDSDPLLFFNADSSAFATVKYGPKGYTKLAHNLSVLSKVEVRQLFADFSTLIGGPEGDDTVVAGFLEIFGEIKNPNKFDHRALNTAVTIFTNLGQAIGSSKYFSDKAVYAKTRSVMDSTATRLISPLQWDDLTKIEDAEVQLRNSILSISYTCPAAQKVGKKLYKKLIHGPKGSVPKALLDTVFALTQAKASVKEYKEIHKLVRAPGLVDSNVIPPASKTNVQTAAINSLGFVTSPELRKKTLDFVTTNMGLTMVELALVGFGIQPEAYRPLWQWFQLHFAAMYSKYLRDPDTTFGKFFKNTAQLVFECCLQDSEGLAPELAKFLSVRDTMGALKEMREEAEEKCEKLRGLSRYSI